MTFGHATNPDLLAGRTVPPELEGIPFTPVHGGAQNGIFCRVGRPKVTTMRRRRARHRLAAAPGVADGKPSKADELIFSYWDFIAGHCPAK
jgi:hypothetical protein